VIEDPAYLSTQLITCLGNKRALLPEIGAAVERVRSRLGGRRLRVLDGFSGSGVVSRLLKRHARHLVANDLETFAATLSRCFLRNRSEIDLSALFETVAALNAEVDRWEADPGRSCPGGFIEELYAPSDDRRIRPGERAFYTRQNARRLDRYRQLLNTLPDADRVLCLGPLLGRASVHANTAGVFKGFYKDRKTGIGRFGGSQGDALQRILGKIRLEPPVLSRFECEVDVRQQDVNGLVGSLPGLDLAYFDPPYNQHPYGSNYFMLNLIVRNERPIAMSRVSGIPVDWTRSEYNTRSRAALRLRELVHATDARFILISFNDEGFIDRRRLEADLRAIGWVDVVERRYNAFRGSRNLRGRPLHVTERLFLVERR